MNAGFGYEDGTSIVAFSVLPDAGSTHPSDDVDFQPVAHEGRDQDGQLVFAWQSTIYRIFTLVWGATDSDFADTIIDYVSKRRLRYYPDVDVTATYRRVIPVDFQVRQVGEIYYITLVLQEF